LKCSVRYSNDSGLYPDRESIIWTTPDSSRRWNKTSERMFYIRIDLRTRNYQYHYARRNAVLTTIDVKT